MRILLIAPLLIAATPALAREGAPPMDLHAAARQLDNPLVQGAVAGMITRLSDVLLDTHVCPLAALTSPDDDIRSGDTLGDLVARDDPDYRRRLYDRSRGAVAGAGRAAGAAAAMSEELARTAGRLRGVLGQMGADRY